MINVYTIGVYNSTETRFFEKLTNNNIDLFLDIRQRRGVRGSQYKFVNSNYLQAKLKDLGIAYEYIKDLAPTKEIRQMQKEADRKNGETKKQRTTLGDVFASEYAKQILDNYDVDELAQRLVDENVKNVVLFCVEENAAACHRSIVARELASKLKIKVIDL